MKKIYNLYLEGRFTDLIFNFLDLISGIHVSNNNIKDY